MGRVRSSRNDGFLLDTWPASYACVEQQQFALQLASDALPISFTRTLQHGRGKLVVDLINHLIQHIGTGDFVQDVHIGGCVYNPKIPELASGFI